VLSYPVRASATAAQVAAAAGAAITHGALDENAIQLELNGTTDTGSRSNLATVGANLVGATKTLDLLTPLLVNRYPKLSSAKAAPAGARSSAAAYTRRSIEFHSKHTSFLRQLRAGRVGDRRVLRL
jgi:hypothetical protein